MSRLVQKVGLAEGAGLYEGGGLYKFGTFDPLTLNPYLFFDSATSMKNSSGSAASFLQTVPTFSNSATGSNAGGNATQSTALNQPRALPLVNGEGYLYVSGVTGNYASTPDHSSLDISSDILIEVDLTCLDWANGNYQPLVSKYDFSDDGRGYLLWIRADGKLQWYLSEDGTASGTPSVISSAAIPFSERQRGKIRAVWNNSTNTVQFFTSSDSGQNFTQLGSDLTRNATGIFNSNEPLQIGMSMGMYSQTAMAFHSVQIYDSVTPSSSSLKFNCDFTDSSVADGASSFAASSGQTVTINKSGQDPATLVRFDRLRFFGANGCLGGSFASTISSGYMFVVFRVLGNGGESTCRVFAINSTGQQGHELTGFIVSARVSTDDLTSYYAGWKVQHDGKFSDALGNVLHQMKFTANSQLSRFNGGDDTTRSQDLSAVSAEEYTIAAADTNGADSANIDILALSLFPSTITDEQAAQVVSYYNSKFSLF